MFKKFYILSILLLGLLSHAWAQDKPEPKLKPTPIVKSEASTPATDAPKAPSTPSRALLARPLSLAKSR